MKKLLLFIVLFFIGINTSFATWTINGDTVYPGGEQIVTECNTRQDLIGSTLEYFMLVYSGVYEGNDMTNSCGTWSINNTNIFPSYTYIIDSCSNEPDLLNETVAYFDKSLETLNNVCGENPIIEIENNINPLIELANNTGSGAINGATGIMSGPIGYIVYFILGLSLLGIVIYSIKKFFN